MNRREFLRHRRRGALAAVGARRALATRTAAGPGVPPRRRHRARRACGSATTAAPTAASCCPRRMGAGLRVPRLRRRRLAGHPARQRHGLAGPHARARPRCSSITTTATARSPTSRARAGLDVELYGMGVAVGDFNNDGFPDVLITCVGQNRLFRNTGKGTFVDVTTRERARRPRSASARRRCGSTSTATATSTCSSATTSSGRPSTTCSAASTARQKSYCTPEAYRGDTCWLFRNRGDGTFEDVTATSGIFDTSSKSLGVAMLDDDQDGWPDLVVANDTQPNKLYRNQRNGTLQGGGRRSRRGVQRRRRGPRRHGHRRRRLRQLRPAWASPSPTSTARWSACTAPRHRASTRTSPCGPASAQPSRNRLGFGCVFADLDLDGTLDLVVANGHIDEHRAHAAATGPGHAQPPLALPQSGRRHVPRPGRGGRRRASRSRASARGLACGDFDGDGDVDLLMTTNNGPAVLFRNDQTGRPPQPAVHADGDDVEPRRHRRARARRSPTASRSRGWSRAARATCRSRSCRSPSASARRDPRRSRRRRLAERPHRGVHERRDRAAPIAAWKGRGSPRCRHAARRRDARSP